MNPPQKIISIFFSKLYIQNQFLYPKPKQEFHQSDSAQRESTQTINNSDKKKQSERT